MIRAFNVYEQFIADLIGKVSFMRTDTVVNCLCRYFTRLYRADALMYIRSTQKLGYIIVTGDGWCLTKAKYRGMCDDKTFRNLTLDNSFRLESIAGLHVTAQDRNYADAMQVVADMMPQSSGFMIGASPWYIQFITEASEEKESRLFQITTFRKGEELAMEELLSSLNPPVHESLRSQIRRIAILDDPEMTWCVPHIGFTAVCTLDPEDEYRLKVVEKRSVEEAWKSDGKDHVR